MRREGQSFRCQRRSLALQPLTHSPACRVLPVLIMRMAVGGNGEKIVEGAVLQGIHELFCPLLVLLVQVDAPRFVAGVIIVIPAAILGDPPCAHRSAETRYRPDILGCPSTDKLVQLSCRLNVSTTHIGTKGCDIGTKYRDEMHLGEVSVFACKVQRGWRSRKAYLKGDRIYLLSSGAG